MKTLAQYLAEYLDQEINEYESREHENPQDKYFGETELREWIKEGIDAYMSTEDVEVLVQPVISCETCRKQGRTNCGNDTLGLLCWEG